MTELCTLIMAAGKGTRMKSDLPKVLHTLHGKTLIGHVIEQARSIGATRIVAIIGHRKEMVMESLAGSGVEFAIQEQQLGTGHAIMVTEKQLQGWSGDVLILSGDVPRLRAETLEAMLEQHRITASQATVLTTELENPHGYGRILRNEDGTLLRIVEEKDATDEIRGIREINSGIYLFDKELLFDALSKIGNDNAQKEYYLTDVLPMMIGQKHKVSLYLSPDASEIQGINTVEQLQEMEKLRE